MKKWLIASSIIVVSLVAVMAFFSPKPSDSSSWQPPPVLVQTVTVQLEDIPIKLTATGHVSAKEKVDVKPQVSGVVEGVHIKEGQNIAPGQLLFTLESAAEQAQLKKAEAQRLRDEVLLKNAERDLARSKSLLEKKYVSPSAIDTLQSNMETLQATVAADQAEVDAAKTALNYKTIRATIPGRVGAIDIYPGSLVQPTMAQPMVTITHIHPVNVTFTLPERDLVTVRQTTGKVMVTLPDNPQQPPLTGKLIFIDNVINEGAINLKAEFANTDDVLWPGQFVNVVLNAGDYSQAANIPVMALLTEPEGKFAYSVNSEQRVEKVPLKLLAIRKDQAIVQGLKTGQVIVSSGGLNLRPGSKVTTSSSKSEQSQRS